MDWGSTITRLAADFSVFFGKCASFLGVSDKTSLIGYLLFLVILAGTALIFFLIFARKTVSAEEGGGGGLDRRLAKMEVKIADLAGNVSGFIGHVRDDLGYLKHEMSELKIAADCFSDLTKLQELTANVRNRLIDHMESSKSDQVLVACELREMRVALARIQETLKPSGNSPKPIPTTSGGNHLRAVEVRDSSSDSEDYKAASERSPNEKFFVD